jgi:hypothetical protein
MDEFSELLLHEWSLILREEHKLQVPESTVLRKIFVGPKKDELIYSRRLG